MRMNVELKGEQAVEFADYLFFAGITFETSDAGFGYRHFVIEVKPEQKAEVDRFWRMYRRGIWGQRFIWWLWFGRMRCF